MDSRAVITLIKRSLNRGQQPQRLQNSLWLRTCCGNCTDPVRLVHRGRVLQKGPISREGEIQMEYVVVAPCRQCKNCRARRAAHWRRRAATECAATEARNARTWRVTLTCSPENHVKLFARGRKKQLSRGNEVFELGPDAEFKLRADTLYEEVAAFLKRVRKESAAPIRFMAVMERHETGLPHVHLLVHEQDASRPVRKKLLQGQWTLGFSACKLADSPRAAEYATKYISKEIGTKVRASLRYGDVSSGVWDKTPREPKNDLRSIFDRMEAISEGEENGSSLSETASLSGETGKSHAPAQTSEEAADPAGTPPGRPPT